ncbi:uncharacterized protein LOC144195499 [Stigmatopora nigra]
MNQLECYQWGAAHKRGGGEGCVPVPGPAGARQLLGFANDLPFQGTNVAGGNNEKASGATVSPPLRQSSGATAAAGGTRSREPVAESGIRGQENQRRKMKRFVPAACLFLASFLLLTGSAAAARAETGEAGPAGDYGRLSGVPARGPRHGPAAPNRAPAPRPRRRPGEDGMLGDDPYSPYKMSNYYPYYNYYYGHRARLRQWQAYGSGYRQHGKAF